MADENLAPEGEGAQVEVTEGAEQEGGQQQADDTPEPIANLARDMGWTPREEWHGEPEKWKPAEQFIRDGREIQQTTARELRSMREQMERMGQVTETIVQDRVSAARAEWEAKIARAVDDGDTETALKLANQQPAGVQPKGNVADAVVQPWIAKNTWFNTDPLAHALAKQVSELNAHLPVSEQLAEAEKAVRKRFPEHFPAPAKAPPATQTGAARSTGASNRVKGFADMPLASQQVALDYEKRLGVPKEQTAKSYWADQEGVKR